MTSLRNKMYQSERRKYRMYHKVKPVKVQPKIDLEKIDGWYKEGAYIHSGHTSKINKVHYYYKSLFPLCNSGNIEEITRFKVPGAFAMKKKCERCLKIRATYSDLSSRITKP